MRVGMTRRRFMQASFAGAALVNLNMRLEGKSMSKMPFKLGIISDEITQDLEQALKFLDQYSLHYVELREMWQKNIMSLSKQELARAREMIRAHNLTVSDIGSPVYKYNIPNMPARPEKRDTFRANFTEQDSEDLLKRSFELAHYFGTPKVRVFSYWRVPDPTKAYPYVREKLAHAADLAGKNGILLVLENEHECNVGTGAELAHILDDIRSPHLRGNWDPGNDVMLGEVPYPNGYELVRGKFAHVHVKDVRKDPVTGKLKWAPVGGGIIDWKGQFQALLDDHYDGTMSLETHYRRPDGNRMESTRESLEGLLHIVQNLKAPAHGNSM